MQHPGTGDLMYYKVLSDNNHVREVEVRDSIITVIVTFDKLSESFEVQTINARDGHESIEEARRYFDRVTVVSGPRPYSEEIWIQD